MVKLSNGLAVRVLSTPGKPSAAALLSVTDSSHNEPQAWPGLAHLLEHILFGDSQQYCGAECLMPWTEAAGGQVNASTEAASTQFFFEVLAAALAWSVAKGHPLHHFCAGERHALSACHAALSARCALIIIAVFMPPI